MTVFGAASCFRSALESHQNSRRALVRAVQFEEPRYEIVSSFNTHRDVARGGAVNAHDVGVGARVGGVGAMKTGASIDGRLFAPTAVTLQKNNIAVP